LGYLGVVRDESHRGMRRKQLDEGLEVIAEKINQSRLNIIVGNVYHKNEGWFFWQNIILINKELHLDENSV
jgi:hypothetical protein